MMPETKLPWNPTSGMIVLKLHLEPAVVGGWQMSSLTTIFARPGWPSWNPRSTTATSTGAFFLFTASSRFHACGKRDAFKFQLPLTPYGAPVDELTRSQLQSGGMVPVGRASSAIWGDMAALPIAGEARKLASARLRPDKSSVSGAATSTIPSRGRPPSRSTPAVAKAVLTWSTVAVAATVTRMRVRDTMFPKIGCCEMSASAGAGKACSGMWARAKSVPAPAKPVSPDTVMVPPAHCCCPSRTYAHPVPPRPC